MKHLKFFAALCCVAAVFAACEKNEPSDNTNGNGINTNQNGGNSNTGSDNATGNNNHAYVDLGLPSGLKWATCNVGATKPEEYGNYYAWGETEPKTAYNESTYSYPTRASVIPLDKDAARANWGGQWRMPTHDEWTELRENCTWTWTSDYNGTGVAGQIVTSNINGNSIFLPPAGWSYNTFRVGYYGYYWSSSLYTYYPSDALYVHFGSDFVDWNNFDRYVGLSVRPVLGE